MKKTPPLALGVALGATALWTALALASSGDIRTVAGGGAAGDGASAINASLAKPRRVAFLPSGGFLVVQFGNGNAGSDGRVRKVSASGVISTFAGDGQEAFSGDGGPATGASLNGPSDIALTADGGVLIADEFNARIRKVGTNGVISSVAGSGQGAGSVDLGDCPSSPASGDNASSYALVWPRGLASESGGRYLVVDELCGTVQRVSPGVDGVTGSGDDTITTVATGLKRPKGVAAFPGGFYVADSGNNRVVKFTNSGATVVAGTGSAGYSGDGGQAAAAQLRNPRDVETAPDGGFLIADSDNYRVRRVTPDGVIRTIAGTGANAVTGDGGAATSAAISQPHGVNIAPNGDVYVSGSGYDDALGNAGYRVRVVEGVFGQGGGTTTTTTTTTQTTPTGTTTQTTPTGTTTQTTPAGTTTQTSPPSTTIKTTPTGTVTQGSTTTRPPTTSTTTTGRTTTSTPTGTATVSGAGSPTPTSTTTAGSVSPPGWRALAPRPGAVAGRTVTLRWARVAGAQGYRVDVFRAIGARRVRVATRRTSKLSVRLDTRGLGGRGRYAWRVSVVIPGAGQMRLADRHFVVRAK